MDGLGGIYEVSLEKYLAIRESQMKILKANRETKVKMQRPKGHCKYIRAIALSLHGILC